MRFLKPLDEHLLDAIAAKGYRRIVTIEDGVRLGGFGEAVETYFAEHQPEYEAFSFIRSASWEKSQ
jgi:1-deoxy-D-xylulose-5-phosphate synthase